MKIVSFHPRPGLGGAFRKYFDMMEAALDEGWEVHYLSTTDPGLRHERFHFHKVPGLGGSWLVRVTFFLCLQPVLLALQIKHRFDVIALFDQIVAFPCLPLKFIFRIPLLTFVRGDILHELELNRESLLTIVLFRFFLKVGLWASDLVCANSEDMRDRMEDGYRVKVSVLHNNVDTEHFFPRNDRVRLREKYGLPPDEFIVGYCGKLTLRKSVGVLVRAFALVPPGDSSLLIVGEGHKEGELKALVRQFDLTDRVRFMPWQTEISAILNALDLLVLPSEYEGCPSILLEAMGCDTPCIASDVRGTREVLHFDELMFPYPDAEKLADMIARASTDRLYNERLKELCRQRKEGFVFDWKKKVAGLIRQASSQ